MLKVVLSIFNAQNSSGKFKVVMSALQVGLLFDEDVTSLP